MIETTEKLLADNYSPKANDQIIEWREYRHSGQLFVVFACSDARLILPKFAYHIRTISAAGPRSPWEGLLNYPQARGILIFDHFDCGGLEAKSKIELGASDVDDDKATGFAKDHIWSTDPIRQSLLTASWTASRTSKHVLAVVQDHCDGKLYVQGAFHNNDQTEHKTVPTYLLTQKYIDEDIYANGRPELRADLVPPLFHPSLNEVDQKAARLLVKYPDFEQKQLVQDPEFIVLSTITKPFEVRFPSLCGDAFIVNIKRQSLDEHSDIDNKYIKEGLRQMHYPLSHCVDNQNFQGRAAFKNSRCLIIETGKMEDSERLFRQISRRDYVNDWLGLPDREIIISEVIAGHIQQIRKVA